MKLIVTILVLIFAFPFFFGLALVVLTVYGKIVGHPGIWTKKLKELWPKLEGYKQYIELVELDKVKFEASVNVAGTKNKALPYAVGLGMNTDWKQRFGA